MKKGITKSQEIQKVTKVELGKFGKAINRAHETIPLIQT